MTSESQAFAIPPRPEAPPATTLWSRSGRLMTGSALIVMLIALFLPWYSATQGIPDAPDASAPQIGAFDGPTSHGFLWIVLALATAGIALIAAGDAIGPLPGHPLAPRRLLIGATGIAFLLCLLGVVLRPANYTFQGFGFGFPLGVADPNTVFVGWSHGGFVAVIAAELALVAVLTAPRPGS